MTSIYYKDDSFVYFQVIYGAGEPITPNEYTGNGR